MSEFTYVKGLSELQVFLEQFPAKMEANIMRAALRQGANVVRDAARQNLAANSSVKSGFLRDSLRVRTGKKKSGVVYASVKADGDPANQAIWVEYGTAAHFISVPDVARPKKIKRNGIIKLISMKTFNKMVSRGSLVIGGKFVGESVHHPGAKPKPFLRTALDSQSQAALLAVGEAIKKRLTKQGLDASGVDLEAP